MSEHPLFQLGDEDLRMITEFVLVSGSIKDLSSRYGVSYPTMRQRLDRLIKRVAAVMGDGPQDPMADLLADLIAVGQISTQAAARIRDLHRGSLEGQGDCDSQGKNT